MEAFALTDCASCAPPAALPMGLDANLLARMDRPGPRYTSYPTADRFHAGFGAAELRQALAARLAQQEAGTLDARAPLSLYIHIPFCASVCYYCGCNKVVTKDRSKVASYLSALRQELHHMSELLGSRPALLQLHFGGGTPTYLEDADMAALLADIRARFELMAHSECSIEIDPRTVTADRLAVLSRMGFNRLSFGVQDFDPQVQAAVHRLQPFNMVRDLMLAARQLPFQSINVDLIYGLPRQTPESFAHTIEQVAGLRPDRIAMYGYAHLPERFKPQRRIVDADLPSGPQRVGMLGLAIGGFLAQGYEYIGMDHFALPADALSVAKRAGQLHRNFQGYSTYPDCDLIALGVSAISRIGKTYSQNAKTLDTYVAALEGGALPTERGICLERDDLVRRAAIMGIMCHGELDFEAFGREHGLVFEAYFAPELARLSTLQDEGLLSCNERGLKLSSKGWFFVRAVAMVFDRYLQGAAPPARFSKVV